MDDWVLRIPWSPGMANRSELLVSREWLVANGYKRLDAVELPGEFSRRGGILDIFSLDAEDPVRLEFFGDEIESIRPFSAGSQRSLGELKAVSVLGRVEASTSPPQPPLPEARRGG